MNQTGKASHTSPAKVHAFAHLGEYPYTYIGYEYLTYQACPGAPIQVGGACDHCLTGIKDAFYFRSADGKKFKVGSTCVAKAGDQDWVEWMMEHAGTSGKIKVAKRIEKEVKNG